MTRLRNLGLLLLWLVTVALGHYELVDKAPRTPLGPLPGSAAAARADRHVPYRARTGLVPVDRLLHEGEEAVLFYRYLLGARTSPHAAGSAPAPAAPPPDGSRSATFS